MAKRAVLVGCNYPGSDSELSGCINDVTNMKQLLIDIFGFDESNIVFMADTDPDAIQPTNVNIRRHLQEAIQASEEGDVIFFQFSGHGGPIPAESGDPEDNGEDECIYPTDMANPLTDDSFRDILAELKPGVTFTIVADSCYSGGLLDSAELQVGLGEDGQEGDETEYEATEQEPEGGEFQGPTAARLLTTESFMQHLARESGHDVQLGNIRATIYELNKDDACATVKVFMKNMVSRLEEEIPQEEWADRFSEVGIRALEAIKQTWDDEQIDNDEYFGSARNVSGRLNFSGHANAKPLGETLAPETGILISGCEFEQLSQDGEIGLTTAIVGVVRACNGQINNKDLVNKIRKLINKRQAGLDLGDNPLNGEKVTIQRPCLYCAGDKVEANFICEV